MASPKEGRADRINQSHLARSIQRLFASAPKQIPVPTIKKNPVILKLARFPCELKDPSCFLARDSPGAPNIVDHPSRHSQWLLEKTRLSPRLFQTEMLVRKRRSDAPARCPINQTKLHQIGFVNLLDGVLFLAERCR